MAKSKSKKASKPTTQKTSSKPKKEVLLKGIALHLLTYIIICAVLIITDKIKC